MRFLTEDKKKHFKLHQHGKFHCQICKRRCKGNYVILQDKGTKAEDGTRAFRIFFACDDYAHITFVGYTKPVDFNKNYGETDNYGVSRRSFAEEEAEAEMEFQEWLNWDPIHKRVY